LEPDLRITFRAGGLLASLLREHDRERGDRERERERERDREYRFLLEYFNEFEDDGDLKGVNKLV